MRKSFATALAGLVIVNTLVSCANQFGKKQGVAPTISGTVYHITLSGWRPIGGIQVTCTGLIDKVVVRTKSKPNGRYVCNVSGGQKYVVSAEAQHMTPRDREAYPGDSNIDLHLSSAGE